MALETVRLCACKWRRSGYVYPNCTNIQ